MSTTNVEFLNVRKGYLKSNVGVEVSVSKVGLADRVVLNRCDPGGKVTQVHSQWVEQPASNAPPAQRRLCVLFDQSKLVSAKASSSSQPILFYFAYENVAEDVRTVSESGRFYLCENENDLASLCPSSSAPGSERSSFDVLSFPEGSYSGKWPSNAGDRLSSPLSGWSESEMVSYHPSSHINTDVISGESFEELSGGSMDVVEIGPDDIQRVAETERSASKPAPTHGSGEDEMPPIFVEDEDTVVPMPTDAPASVAYEFVSLPRDSEVSADEQPSVNWEDSAMEKEEKAVAMSPEVESLACSKGSMERIRRRSNSADSLPRLSPQEKDMPVPPLERSLSDTSYNLVSHSEVGELRHDQEVMLLKGQLKEKVKQIGQLERKLEEVTQSKGHFELLVQETKIDLVETKEALTATKVELENVKKALYASHAECDDLRVSVVDLKSKLARADEKVRSQERDIRLKTNEMLQAYREARLFAQEVKQLKRASLQKSPKSKERRPQSAKASGDLDSGDLGEGAGSEGVSLTTGSAYRRRKSTASCASIGEGESKSDRVRRQTSHQSSSADDLSGLHEVSSIIEAQLFMSEKRNGDAPDVEEDMSDEDLSKLAMSLQGLQSVCPYCHKFLRGFETELLRNLHYEECYKYQETLAEEN